MKTKILSLTVGFLMVSALISARANDTATTTITAEVGLSPVLTVTCTSVQFGNWRIPNRTTGGGTTTITLTRSGDSTVATPSGNTANVALSSKFSAPAAGECTVSGTTVFSGPIPITISNNENMAFDGVSANSTRVPTVDAALDIDLKLASSNVMIGQPGTSATFYVLGSVTIPESFSYDNVGGYRTTTGATITVTDIVFGDG